MGQRASSAGNLFSEPDPRSSGYRMISAETTLPLDIMNILLEMLDREGVENAVLLNRDLYRFVNKRLWSELMIYIMRTVWQYLACS